MKHSTRLHVWAWPRRLILELEFDKKKLILHFSEWMDFFEEGCVHPRSHGYSPTVTNTTKDYIIEVSLTHMNFEPRALRHKP